MRSIQSSVRYAIGIDAGAHTGLARWNVQDQRIDVCLTQTFWETYEELCTSYLGIKSEVVIIIETPEGRLYKARNRAQKSKGVVDRMARNVGMNAREAALLAEGLERAGFDVRRRKPVAQKKWTIEYFRSLTGWTGKLTQHAVDAGRLCIGVNR